MIKARPTIYKGIHMRSRLEARFAGFLDESKFRWQYEPRCFAGSGGQYLPDFLLHHVLVGLDGAPPAHRSVYVEVKPTFDLARGVIDRMRVIWESDPAALLLAWAPGIEVPEPVDDTVAKLFPGHAPTCDVAGVLWTPWHFGMRAHTMTWRLCVDCGPMLLEVAAIGPCPNCSWKAAWA